MSDALDNYNFQQFKHLISIDSGNSLQYVRGKCRSTEEVALKVKFTCKCLKGLFEIKNTTTQKISYVEILNVLLVEKWGIKVKSDCSRLEGRLRRLCSETYSKFGYKTGDAYRKLSDTVREIDIRQGELVSIIEVERDLEDMQTITGLLEEENSSLQNRCDNLYKELLKAEAQERETQGELEAAYIEMDTLKSKNSYLYQYVEKIEEQQNFENTGGKMTEVKERQKRRKLRELKTNVEKSLWFAKTLGLNLDSAWFKDTMGETYVLDYPPEVHPKSFNDLPDVEQEKVKSVLFLTDKFCISESAYHELTMTTGGERLPRSYLIKQCKDNLNQLCNITRTPGEADGAQLVFKEELDSRLRSLLSQQPDVPNKIKIKLSGDGAKMTRVTNFIVISYSILDTDEHVMSSKGNHAIAVIKGHEDYHLLKYSCKDVFEYINKLVNDGNICIDGKCIPVEIFVGGDYKFLLLVLGMKGATSDFACIWCKCHKRDRHDMSKSMGHYWEDHIVRTIEDCESCASRKKFSCEHPPLLKVPLQNIIMDELHLMLRITDNLLTNLVQEAVEWDKEDNHNKAPCLRKHLHLDALVASINSCGVCFSVWEKKNADGRGSATFDFTSLMGSDKKVLLHRLPPKLAGVIRPQTSSTVIKLWEGFDEVYKMINKEPLSEQDIKDYFAKAQQWVEMFTSLGSLCQGYIKERVTPYMHCMVYHSPRFMADNNGIKKFSGQGVEKKNDDCRRIHLQKSNKWDAPKDVLLVLKRQERLSNLERTPRQYLKRNLDYWETKIREKRTKQLSTLHAAESESSSEACEDNQIDVENISPVEIRNRLKTMGVTTRVRNVQKLQKMYADALAACSSVTES